MSNLMKLMMGTVLCGYLSVPLTAPAQAAPVNDSTQVAQTDTSDKDDLPDEEPELPESMLVLPDDDPNAQPLEEEFFRMLPVQNPWFWRAELRNSTSYLSNVDQVANSPSGMANRLSLSGVLRYSMPSNTQILLRSQGFLNNYFGVQDPADAPRQRDQFLAIPLSPTVSQWFWDSLNIYSSYVPIFSSSLGQAQTTQRLDHDILLGASYYWRIAERDYLFSGYQFDTYMSADPSFSSLGNLFFMGYRHSFTPDMFLLADARFQPKGYTDTPELLDELRFGGGVALQWHIFRPWFIIEARTDYNQVVNFTRSERSAGIYSAGINLISAIQSK